MMASPRWTLVLLAAAACGDNLTRPVTDGAPPADAPPVDTISDTPPDASPLETLAGTGLCVDPGCTQINPGIRAYEPQAQLWSDTAGKRRWIYLPPGTKIDTTDMDHWVFPVGTRLWKEFTRDGTRVETRLLVKQLADENAPNAWFFATYQWNATQDGTTLVTTGVQNANGTQHDIPSRADCRECHDSLQPTRVLGFGAIQLDYDAPADLTDLEDLIAADLLTTPPAGTAPHFLLPGTQIDQAALRYFHANCGHCHNPKGRVYGHTLIDLRLRTTQLGSVAETPAYLTTVNQNASVPYDENGVRYDKVIIPKDPMNSAVIARMNSMIPFRFMPNLGAEVVDPAGQAALVNWINSL